MCCILEVGMLVFGIVVPAKGKVSVTKNQVITGGPAYAIGVILCAVLPLALVIALVVGLYEGLQNPGGQGQADLLKYAWIDITLVVGAFVAVVVIFVIAPKQDKMPPGYPGGMPGQYPLGQGWQQPGASQGKDPNDNPFKDYS